MADMRWEKVRQALHRADAYQQRGQWTAAIAACREAIAIDPDSARSYARLGSALQGAGDREKAIKAYVRALECDRDRRDTQLRLLTLLEEPLQGAAIFADQQELEADRAAGAAGLQVLIDLVQGNPALQPLALRAIASPAYHQFVRTHAPDCALQAAYGQFVSATLAIACPELSEPLSVHSRRDRPRVGFMLQARSPQALQPYALWLEDHPSEQWQPYRYWIGSPAPDPAILTERDRLWSPDLDTDLPAIFANFRHGCHQIRADELDVLIWLDLGSNPYLHWFAGVRLAPIQCATWAYPLSTGLPTMDYYLSGTAIEPPQADFDYTEALITLPGMGWACPRPHPDALAPRPAVRAEFGVDDHSVFYLAGQPLADYAPSFDAMLVALLQAVPEAQVAFVNPASRAAAPALRDRLSRHLEAAGLDPDHAIVILPTLDPATYAQVCQLADVFLDAPGRSGRDGTAIALANGLPVVTWAGDRALSRRAAAMLQVLDLGETEARSAADYLERAIALGQDRRQRIALSQRITHRLGQLFATPEGPCVARRALREFCDRAIAQRG